jgi:hypothetical protein
MMGAIYKEGYSALEQFVQQEAVKKHFPSCKTRIEKQILFVDFKIQDPDYLTDYHLQILYRSQSQHKVFILSPRITPAVVIHMNPDTSLCLYYPPDISPFRRLGVSKDLIPMAALWVCHYEQWLINGNKWMGREAPGHQRLIQQLSNVYR